MKKILYIGLLVIAVFISGCNGPEATLPPGPNTVNIQNFAYNPATITVTNGSTVTWIQLDSEPHDVKGDGFDSGHLNKDETFSWTFNETGTFSYGCSYHPAMNGKVIVR